MKKICLALASAALLCVTPAIAQERTAGGSLQNEASWSALKSLVDKAQGDTNLNKIDIKAIKDCAASGKLYAGAGCRDIVDNRIDQIIRCGNLNKVYSSAKGDCADIAGGTRWVYHAEGPTSSSSLTQSSARSSLERKLKEAGLWYCSDVIAARKCNVAGQKCVNVSNSSETVGDKNEHTRYTYSSAIYRCD